MSRPIWKFREKQPAEIHQESAHTEFFADQYVADRLVRESGQNTLDASLNGGPTRLVFTFTEAPAESFEHYLKGLWPHLEEQPELRASLPHPLQPIPALVVEDFGTTGLTGPLDVRGDLAESNEPDHRLYWFFKNIGRTSKSGDQLGSFGIGKTVFPYSSRINTFFGFSTRLKSDGVPTSVLLGQAHLREHRLPASGDLDPIGFFAWQEGSGAGYVQRPISEEDHLEHFRNTFGLTRQSAETGLSVVIPYPDTELGAQAVGRAVLEHFFLPILSGRLAVEIRSTSGMLLELSTTTLLRAVEHLGWTTDQSELIRKRIELARWAYTDGQRDIITLGLPTDAAQPKFDESMLDTELRTKLSELYLSGRRLSFRVPVPVEPKGGKVVYSNVDIFLELDSNASKSDETYAREGLTLIDHCGLTRQAGLRSILLAQDPVVSALLRSSENVSHTKWRQRSADRLRSQYERGPSKINYILGLVPGIVQTLLSPAETADWWTLSDLFPEPRESGLSSQPTASTDDGDPSSGPPDNGTPTEDDVEVPPFSPTSSRQWLCRPSRAGLVVESNPKFQGQFRPMKLTAAYGLPNRTGFGAHRREDFSFFARDSMFRGKGASVEPIGENILLIRPTGSSFRVEVEGFDPRRALDYRITIQEES